MGVWTNLHGSECADALGELAKEPGERSHVAEYVAARAVWIDYTNWRKERRWRHIMPLRVVFEATKWHPTPQWLLVATDLETHEQRSFALADVHCWTAQVPADWGCEP